MFENGMNGLEGFGFVVAEYDKYARQMKAEGKQPVAFFKFAMGQF